MMQTQDTSIYNNTVFDGIVISSHRVKDSESKEQATKSLVDWKPQQLTAIEWIRHLEQGHTIQPSLFTPKANGKYTHASNFWKQTNFICCDADNIKGVEFLTDNTDKNPDGVDPFSSETGLSELYPTLKDKAFAIGQSLPSMSKEKNTTT